jgi:Uma2 family endonuclease
MIDASVLMTADELLRYDAGGHRSELIRGQLVVREPTGGTHAGVLTELVLAVGAHVRSLPLSPGRVLAGDPGFWLARDPDTVRAPDLAFVSHEQLAGGAVPDGFLQGVPDLAVEIRSPSDRRGTLLQKVGQWLEAGTSLVWVIDPATRSAQVYHADGSVVLIGPDDALDGAPVLRGLRVPLVALWGR